MEGMRWRPFSGRGQVVFSLLSVRPAGRKYKEKKRRPNWTWYHSIYSSQPTTQYHCFLGSYQKCSCQRNKHGSDRETMVSRDPYYRPKYSRLNPILRERNSMYPCKKMNIWILPKFYSGDLVAVLVNYNEA
jgi:hypothetical protein